VRAQRLLHTQELDNFIFANDVLVTVSAGNSPAGLKPPEQYPGHLEDPRWSMGSWASGANTLKVGAYVGHPAGGIVNAVGQPSPFTRVGPPSTRVLAPEFSAPGGDLSENYQRLNGGGVWCCGRTGAWEDISGTSFAAPLVARELALAMQRLASIAGRPFGVLVRAFMSLTAKRAGASNLKPVQALADRTLGRGFPRANAVLSPTDERAVVLWQGMLAAPGDIARVQIPIPKAWLTRATKPAIRLIVCWDPPVNAAVLDTWLCRDLSVHLKPEADGRTLLAASAPRRGSSPTIERVYDLSSNHLQARGIDAPDESWLLELQYNETAPYAFGEEPALVQRVAFAAEIYDEATKPLSPHDELVKLKSAASMTRLTAVVLPMPSTLLVTV
jgi:Subtilase family